MAFRPSFVAVPLSLAMAGSGAYLVYVGNQPTGTAQIQSEPKHPVSEAMAKEARERSTKPAPKLVGTDATGATIDLSEALKRGPAVVVFIKNGCPCSIESQPVFNQVATNYEGKAQFIGVIDGGPSVATEYQKINEVPFPVVCDPNLEIVARYDIKQSVYVALIAKDGRIEKLWPGYNKQMVGELNDKVASLVGEWPKSVDLKAVPEKMTSGCSFEFKSTRPTSGEPVPNDLGPGN